MLFAGPNVILGESTYQYCDALSSVIDADAMGIRPAIVLLAGSAQKNIPSV